MKVAVVGATGLVGTRMLEVLAERHFQLRNYSRSHPRNPLARKLNLQERNMLSLAQRMPLQRNLTLQFSPLEPAYRTTSRQNSQKSVAE
jgi:aspartate-semialdehyde dehydrogenase